MKHPVEILADHLRRLDIDPREAAGIVVEVAQAIEALMSERIHERWRAERSTPD